MDVEGGTWTWSPGIDLSWLASGRLSLVSAINWKQWFGRPRWIETAADGRPLFGALELKQLEANLRGTFAFSRNLTLQWFGQFLRSAQHYPRTWELSSAFDPPCQDAACAPMPPGAHDQDLTSLIVNAIARWEFRPGSTLFVVYTHNHQVSGTRGAFGLGSAADGLAAMPADNVLAIKLSYLWAL
jgi:hypothetical protein